MPVHRFGLHDREGVVVGAPCVTTTIPTELLDSVDRLQSAEVRLAGIGHVAIGYDRCLVLKSKLVSVKEPASGGDIQLVVHIKEV